MILAGRRINDNMAKFIAERTVKILINAGKQVRDSRVAIMGLTFKENVPDLRNTKVVDIISELKTYGVNVVVHDPIADPDEARAYYGIDLQPLKDLGRVDAVIVAVLHDTYKAMGLSRMARICYDGCPIVIDIKGAFEPDDDQNKEIRYWRL
jgi:UDP-N-acetyl-D-galactosamine dehydrogenase